MILVHAKGILNPLEQLIPKTMFYEKNYRKKFVMGEYNSRIALRF